MFRITRVRPYGWSILYANRYVVDVPSAEYVPIPAQLRISLTSDAIQTHDDFPALTELALTLPTLHLTSTPPTPRNGRFTMKHLTQFLLDFWTGCSQIRTQLLFLSVKWPLTVVVMQPQEGGGKMPSLNVAADVVLHTVKSKIKISFVFDAETVINWPFSVHDVACAVEPVYGSGFEYVLSPSLFKKGHGLTDRCFSCERICADIVERISEATPDNAHGCIVDACIVATAEFARRGRGSTSVDTSA